MAKKEDPDLVPYYRPGTTEPEMVPRGSVPGAVEPEAEEDETGLVIEEEDEPKTSARKPVAKKK